MKLDASTIDTAIDAIIAHEKTITDTNNDLIFQASSVGRWRGIPTLDYNQMLAEGSPYLWLWQAQQTRFRKPGIENMAVEGYVDLQFIIAQYRPEYRDANNMFAEQLRQDQNALVKKIERSLIDVRITTADNKDRMTYDTGKYYFVSDGSYGGKVFDTEDFYFGGIGQMFPFTGKPLEADWYVSVLTSTLYFDNRD